MCGLELLPTPWLSLLLCKQVVNRETELEHLFEVVSDLFFAEELTCVFYKAD